MAGSTYPYFFFPLVFFAGFFLLDTHCHLLALVHRRLDFAPVNFIMCFLIKLSINKNLSKMGFFSDFSLLTSNIPTGV